MIAYYLQYCLFNLIAFLIHILPWPVVESLTALGSDTVFFFYASRRKIALENLDRAFGKSLTQAEKKRIARLSFRHAAYSIMELSLMKSERLTIKNFNFVGLEILERAYERGKGTVLAISHLGSWECLSMLTVVTKQSWSVVVKEIRNPYIDKSFNEFRNFAKLKPIPKKNAVRPILRELKANHGTAILMDQWAGPEGAWQDFFGYPTSTTTIPARLAKRVGSALVLAFCIRRGALKFDIFFIEALSPEQIQQKSELEITAHLTALLEEQIRKYPEQWSWGHRRWKPKPAFFRGSSRESEQMLS